MRGLINFHRPKYFHFLGCSRLAKARKNKNDALLEKKYFLICYAAMAIDKITELFSWHLCIIPKFIRDDQFNFIKYYSSIYLILQKCSHRRMRKSIISFL